MGKKKDKTFKPPKKDREFFLIEGHILNEKTGKLEPYSKKVYSKRY